MNYQDPALLRPYTSPEAQASAQVASAEQTAQQPKMDNNQNSAKSYRSQTFKVGFQKSQLSSQAGTQIKAQGKGRNGLRSSGQNAEMVITPKNNIDLRDLNALHASASAITAKNPL